MTNCSPTQFAAATAGPPRYHPATLNYCAETLTPLLQKYDFPKHAVQSQKEAHAGISVSKAQSGPLSKEGTGGAVETEGERTYAGDPGERDKRHLSATNQFDELMNKAVKMPQRQSARYLGYPRTKARACQGFRYK